ncbi:MAG: hypothetical protein HQK49_03475 [Oligoflexia bacterium]|nr:hypothetical protein [Oligoflexia bacterium]
MKKLFLLSVVTLLSLSVFTSCNDGGNGNNESNREILAKEVVKKLNDEFGTPGVITFTLMKSSGATELSKDFIVVRYVKTGYIDLVHYRAYDLSKYDPNMSAEDYLHKLGAEDLGFGLQNVMMISEERNLYYHEETGMIFEETTTVGKDLEKIGHFIEQYQINMVTDTLVAEFGLSETRAVDLSRFIYNWKKTSDRRSMTAKDVDNAFKKLLGTDMLKAMRAYKHKIAGENREWNDLISKAAQINGITPEHFNKIAEEVLTR